MIIYLLATHEDIRTDILACPLISLWLCQQAWQEQQLLLRKAWENQESIKCPRWTPTLKGWQGF